jgi:Cu(I)/Ag(I) efflux system membrane protein CusA/SilA
MQYYNVSMMEVMKAVKTSNNDVGGRKFEMSKHGLYRRGLGYIKHQRCGRNCHQNYNSFP